jgi:sugar phosphate isomerase/epimerase
MRARVGHRDDRHNRYTHTMAIITHGSDLTLAPTIRPLAQAVGGAARKALMFAAERGFHAVQLDATMPGLRPRELDKSARRDLGATLRRAGLAVSGLDFFIPADHYLDPAHTDRAVESAHAALGLAADLDRAAVSLNLPAVEADPQIVSGLLTAADGLGIRLALHHDQDPAELLAWLKGQDDSLVGGGLDPAALIAARRDPVAELQTFGDRLVVARLSDARRGLADGTRCVVGQGDLDLMSYRVSVDLAARRTGPVVLDLRMLADPLAAAERALAAWDGAAMKM